MPPGSRRPAALTPASKSAAASPAPAEASSPRGTDYGLELEIFWSTHWKKALLAVLLAFLGVIGYSIWDYSQQRSLLDGNARLAGAKTVDELKKVAAELGTSPVAADAWLLLAQKQAEAKDFSGAAASARVVVDKFRDHPLRGAAMLAVAANLDAAGDAEKADAAYKALVDQLPTDFATPLAVYARAGLAKRAGKIDEARRFYDDLTARYPLSTPSLQAAQERKLLRGGSTATDVFKVVEPPRKVEAAPTPASAGKPAEAAPVPPPAVIPAAEPTPAEAGPAATPEVKPSPAAATPAPAKPADPKPAATPAAKKK